MASIISCLNITNIIPTKIVLSLILLLIIALVKLL